VLLHKEADHLLPRPHFDKE